VGQPLTLDVYKQKLKLIAGGRSEKAVRRVRLWYSFTISGRGTFLVSLTCVQMQMSHRSREPGHPRLCSMAIDVQENVSYGSLDRKALHQQPPILSFKDHGSFL